MCINSPTAKKLHNTIEPTINHSVILLVTVVTVLDDANIDSNMPITPATANRIVPANEDAVPAMCG